MWYRFGGGFTEWGQPFRLRHVVTGKFLGVKSVCRANCPSSGVSEEGREEGSEGRKDSLAGVNESRCVAVLLEPRDASFKNSAFCFTNATVSTILCMCMYASMLCLFYCSSVFTDATKCTLPSLILCVIIMHALPCSIY